jgi:hypothetical protein
LWAASCCCCKTNLCKAIEKSLHLTRSISIIRYCSRYYVVALVFASPRLMFIVLAQNITRSTNDDLNNEFQSLYAGISCLQRWPRRKARIKVFVHERNTFQVINCSTNVFSECLSSQEVLTICISKVIEIKVSFIHFVDSISHLQPKRLHMRSLVQS